jgi:protein O-GlcNAc transferase
MSEHQVQVARALAEAGQFEQARAALERVLRHTPGHPAANTVMGHVMIRLGQAERGVYFARRAAEACPGDARVLSNLGTALVMGEQPVEGEAVFRRALGLASGHLPALIGLTNTLNMLRRHVECAVLCHEALRAHPGRADLTTHLALALLHSGRAREAVGQMRALAAAAPEDAAVASGLAGMMNYAGGLTPREVFEVHAAYGRILERRAPEALPLATVAPDPERRLRVGFVSPDLRAHAVPFFVEPLLAGLDPERVRIVCYSTALKHDAVSERLRTLVEQWRAVAGASDADLARMIREDGVDILIDLSGHTQGHRLPVFHRRPAPVQVTYCGYPNTTGLRRIDARIVDSLTDAAPGADEVATERLIRVDPCFVCYLPPALPELASLPAHSGPVTFGSFNNLAKLDDEAVGLWSSVLGAAPGSTLLLRHASLTEEGARDLTRGRFAAHGVPPERLRLEAPESDGDGPLGHYARVDIALDTYPYHGTTTTCEALSMGVPVVSLAGPSHASRVGVSLLHAVGHPEWVAREPQEFVRIAAALAGDVEGLAAIRAGLRGRLLGSALCDGAALARRFEGALRDLWRGWCDGK